MHKFKENVERENQEIAYVLETLVNEIKVNPEYNSWKFKSMYSELDYFKVSKKSLKKAIEIAEESLKKRLYYFSTRWHIYISTQPFSFWFKFKEKL